MNAFQQRSSWPSSLLTGLLGWIGWIFIGPLIFGIEADFYMQSILAISSAIIQIISLRILFFALRMHRGIAIGIFWGALSALGLYAVASGIYPPLATDRLYWVLIYLYIGAPIGGFLSYFYRDDLKIHASNPENDQHAYGRDAHWLEPFGFGVVAYLIAFHPFGPVQLLINVIITGAVSGIAAAGASHFSPDSWKRSYLLLGILIIVLGTAQGAVTGLLFRNCEPHSITNFIQKGIAGGIITYLITFLRGRQLAFKEENGII